MKLGLDIHGVIDADYKLFSKVTRKLMNNLSNKQIRNAMYDNDVLKNEVHIITGVSITDRLQEFLERKGIVWSHMFSIHDYHQMMGTPMIYKYGDKTQPLIDDVLWNATKAQYCRRAGIDLHIDDSTMYGRYFKDIPTQYLIYNKSINDFLITLTG